MISLPTQAIVYDPAGAAAALPGLGAVGEACVRHGVEQVLLLSASAPSAPGRDGLAVEHRAASPLGLDADLPGLAANVPASVFLIDARGWLDINLLDLALSHARADDRWLTAAQAAGPEPTGMSRPQALGSGVCVVGRRALELVHETRSLDAIVGELAGAGRAAHIAYDRPLLRSDVQPRGRGAIFLDRDGVVNEDCGFISDIERFLWLDGTPQAIKRVNDLGLYVFVVTNQSGVARGLFGEDAVHLVHRHIRDELRAVGAHIDDFRHCPYHPQGSVAAYARESSWRKPEPGMLLDIMAQWHVDASRSVMIGDRESDAAAGRAAGMDGYKLAPGETLAGVLDGFLPRLLGR